MRLPFKRGKQRGVPAELKEVGAIGMEEPLGAKSGELTAEPPVKGRRQHRQCSMRTGPSC